MTDPNLKILNRAQAEADARKLIDAVRPVLQELVNYSTSVVLRCGRAGGATYEDMPAFILYLHIVEMTDGIEALISHSCCESVVPLLRSSFEAFTSLQYLFQDDYKRRCLCWLYCDLMERRRVEKLLDAESQPGKELAEVLKKELENVRMPEVSPDLLDYVRRSIEDPHFSPVAKEYEKMRTKKNGTKKKGRPPSWYSLFKGPSNVRRLASQVGMENFYIFEYKQWSSILHGGNASRYIEILANGTVAGHQLRLAENLVWYSHLAGIFLWVATDSMLKKFRPSEQNHARWTAAMKKELLALNKITVDVKRSSA